MRLAIARCCVATGLLLCAHSLGAQVVAPVQVKGSDTIGERLGQDLARTYMAEHPERRIRWESLGSTTAFVGLFDGSADLGASSRPVKPPELEQARAQGVELREYVIGYDGIAVIVHPSNPVAKLDLVQLSRIFGGQLSRWAELGGEQRPIRILSRPSYSGTHVFFKDVVLRRGDSKARDEFAPQTEWIEATSDIVARVAEDPGAISYVGLGFTGERPVKILAVSPAPGEAAIEPLARNVLDGSYPIFRPLYLYTRGDPQGPAREFLSFILSPAGQRRVSAEGFVPSGASAPLPDITAVSTAPRGVRVQEPIRIYFAFGSTQLDPEAQRRLEMLVADGLMQGEHFQIVGHADARGSSLVNRGMALARAEVVANALQRAGAPRELLEIEARGSDEPIATNDSIAGRRSNRRADVRIVQARENAR